MIAKWQIVGMINWGIYSIQRKFAPPPSTMHNGPHDKVGGGGGGGLLTYLDNILQSLL